MFGLRGLWHSFLALKQTYNSFALTLLFTIFEQYVIYTIYGNVCFFSPGLFELYISKAGMFDFGSTDPRNRHAKHTLEGNIPGWARFY